MPMFEESIITNINIIFDKYIVGKFFAHLFLAC